MKEYILQNKENIIGDTEYKSNETNMYNKRGRPRTELLPQGKGLTQCIQSCADAISSADPRRRSEMSSSNLSIRELAKQVNDKLTEKNGVDSNISHTTIYRRTS